MFPMLPKYNLCNAGWGNAKLQGDRFTAINASAKNVTRADYFYFILCEFVKSVFFTTGRYLFTLRKCFFLIFGVVSKFQVCWINTCFVIVGRITIMQDIFTWWDWAFMQNPRSSMGAYHTSTAMPAPKYVSIGQLTSHLVTTSYPQPAFITSKFLNFLPKSFRKVWGQALRSKVFNCNFFRHVKAFIFNFFNVFARRRQQSLRAFSLYLIVIRRAM